MNFIKLPIEPVYQRLISGTQVLALNEQVGVVSSLCWILYRTGL